MIDYYICINTKREANIDYKLRNGDFYADKTFTEVCICSYWLQLFMHEVSDGLAHPLEMKTFNLFML